MSNSNTKHYFSYINEAIKQNWECPAMTDYQGKVSYTYGELAAQMVRISTFLQKEGVKPGDKIAICARSCTHWSLAFLGCEAARSVAVTILSEFAAADINYIINHSDSVILFADTITIKRLNRNDMPQVRKIIDISDFTAVESDGSRTPILDNSISISKEEVSFPTDNIDELALINYTSGTTSSPKGVMLTNRNISSNVTYGQETEPNSPNDNMLSLLPLAHIFGIMFGLLYQLAGGVHIYFLTKLPTPSLLLNAMKNVKPYMMLCVPLVVEKIVNKNILPRFSTPVGKFLWNAPIIKDIVRGKASSALMGAFGGNLRNLIIGGAKLNHKVEKYLRQMHVPYCCGYGMTECGPLIGYANWKDYKMGSVGKAVDRMEIRLNNEGGNQDAAEIMVRGENVTIGYYKNDEATESSFDSEGWFHTGDIGSIDKCGNIFLLGRCKNMILGASGQNIYPEEIESKLSIMEGVADCLVLSRSGKIVALVRTTEEMPEEWSAQTLQALNALLPVYSRVAAIEIMKEDFSKTPKNSIRRHLYK